MAADPDEPTAISVYFTTVTGLSALVILLLYALFDRGISSILNSLYTDPAGTVQQEPVAFALLGGALLAIAALFGVIVVVGVRHAEAAPEELDDH
jgi:hypothetical protein